MFENVDESLPYQDAIPVVDLRSQHARVFMKVGHFTPGLENRDYGRGDPLR
jgi:hypothetical protein